MEWPFVAILGRVAVEDYPYKGEFYIKSEGSGAGKKEISR